MLEKNNGSVFSGLAIGIGIIVAGFFIYLGIIHFKKHERHVLIKSLVTRDVIADKGIWDIKFKISEPTLDKAYKKYEDQKNIIKQFLINENFLDSEITDNLPNTNEIRQLGKQNTSNTYYKITGVLTLKSNNVEQMKNSSQRISKLIKQGIIFDNLWNTRPAYQFTKINNYKSEMLSEATKNARILANEFASNSNSKIGSIRSANQGRFQILSRNENASHAKEIFKSIRVVSSIDFYIVD